MHLKNLVVQVDTSNANESRMALALNLAARHDSMLTGCYTVQSINPVIYSSGTALSGVYESALEAIERDTVAAETAFRNRATAKGVDHHWEQAEGSMASNLVTASRYADLTIAGQFDPDDTHGVEPNIAESLAMESGRPALVVPYIGAGEKFWQRVLVAWDGSRESARAVSDAMPFLTEAEHVDILHMHHDNVESRDQSPSHRLADALQRNGVKAHAEDYHIGDAEVGDALLSRAADLGSGIIVMGAYGHSRLRELVLGGATRDLLRHMTVPVLMAH